MNTKPGWMAAALIAATAVGYGTRYAEVTVFADPGSPPVGADGYTCAPENGRLVCRQKAAPLPSPSANPAVLVAWRCTHIGPGQHDMTRGSCPHDLCEPVDARGRPPPMLEWRLVDGIMQMVSVPIDVPADTPDAGMASDRTMRGG